MRTIAGKLYAQTPDLIQQFPESTQWLYHREDYGGSREEYGTPRTTN